MAADEAQIAEAFGDMGGRFSKVLTDRSTPWAKSRATVNHIPKSELEPCMRAAPFDWPECIGPSSEVVREPQDWADSGILIPHETLRWYHEQMSRVIDSWEPLKPGNEWMIDAFFDWLDKYFIPNVHHHHDAEEKIYMPGIKKAYEAKGLKWDEDWVGGEHEQLMKILEGFKPFRQRIKSGDLASVEEFKTYTREYITTMNAHLKREEEFIPKTLRACMTEGDEAKLVQKILASLGINDHKAFLPAILYAMCRCSV
eukprot:TRINITY_DN109647_c0_g1_i1.p1 TRINITY_DN109647_c0_g1~~TRINITY_DN109647_c0_g1_i1.p1  ORF type:complete len:256 (-),score=53.52 TRINITY_DN109647_c0_g1_i1:336-1103(-)